MFDLAIQIIGLSGVQLEQGAHYTIFAGHRRKLMELVIEEVGLVEKLKAHTYKATDDDGFYITFTLSDMDKRAG